MHSVYQRTSVVNLRVFLCVAWPDPNSRFIVVSFIDATFVLAVGDTVEETRDSGLEGRYPTLACSLLEGDVLLQVHAAGVRQIKGHSVGEKRVIEWPAPGKKTITKAACNSRQCAVALSGGEVVYFELDDSVRPFTPSFRA